MKIYRSLLCSISASLLIGALAPTLSATEYGAWEAPVDGDWFDADKWLGGIPDATGALAEFTFNAGSPAYTITLNQNITLTLLQNNLTDASGLFRLIGTGNIHLVRTSNFIPSLILRDVEIGVSISGNDGILITPRGTKGVTLSGNNTYRGITEVRSGTLFIGHNNALGATGANNRTEVGKENGQQASVALLDGITITDEIILLGRTGNDNSNVNGTLYVEGQNATARWDGEILLGRQAPQISSGSHAGNTMIIGGPIKRDTASGVQSLQITGYGTVLLEGQAEYTDTTTIRMGTLKLGGHDRLNAISSLAIGMQGNTATFDLNGFNQTVANISPSVAASGPANRRTVTNSSLSQHSIITVDGSVESKAMIYTGNLSIVKAGTSNMIIHAESTYTGDTFIEAGTLTLGGLVLHDDSSLHITSGGLLAWASGVTGTDTIDQLFYNGVAMATGTYGSLDNLTATYRVNFILGDAMLEVTTTIPEPGTIAFVFGGGALLLLRIRRRNAASH